MSKKNDDLIDDLMDMLDVPEEMGPDGIIPAIEEIKRKMKMMQNQINARTDTIIKLQGEAEVLQDRIEGLENRILRSYDNDKSRSGQTRR